LRLNYALVWGSQPAYPLKALQIFDGPHVILRLADWIGMQVHQIIETHDGSAMVVEIDESLTPPGMALELHCVTYEDETVAFWLFEDGTVAKIEEVAVA
jgi:hypothetical protein